MEDERRAEPRQEDDAAKAHAHAQQRQPGGGHAGNQPRQHEKGEKRKADRKAARHHEADEDALAAPAILRRRQRMRRLGRPHGQAAPSGASGRATGCAHNGP